MKIGDKVRVLIYGSGSGFPRYVKSIIVKIYDKESFNMYKCITAYGYSICFTNMDLNIRLKNKLVLMGWFDD